ncbi:MAG TPA: L,D-transpeptidase family protein [Solirubrobacteraceae bacterium]|nr:L,D-transpeptidase family protein [Solirubrobacteraceae bacterium]
MDPKVALVSQPRRGGLGNGYQYRRYGRSRTRYVIGGLLALAVLAVVAGIVVLASTSAGLTTDSVALAKVGMPLGGGRISSVSVVTGSHARPVPVYVQGDKIWPRGKVPAGARLSIEVVVKRPGWISWLSGSSQRLALSVVAPRASLRQDYLTLKASQPLRLNFDRPVSAVSYGPSATQLRRHVLSPPSTEMTLTRTADAGTLWVAAAPRSWETAPAATVSWFPAGATTAAVASPAPGTTIGPNTPISLTFSKPISAALGSSRPPVLPITSGSWQQVGSHTIVFHPTGYGYGLGATVRVGLPSGVRLVGGQTTGAAENGAWPVPAGTTLRLQQLLATLGYLPLRFNAGTPVANTPQAQVAAAIKPPSGSFSWSYPNIPSALRNMWAPGTAGEMTKGAVMAFENNQGITPDGVAGPAVWKALLAATMSNRRSAFGYTFVQVSEGSPETEQTWHNGRTVVSGAVNTGIPSAPTAQGVFAVFEHAPSVTMSGTNPDGSHYNDPGVPYVSYFNGGDALHGFLRASYGSAQSLGCVEMPYSEAAAVYPFTPIGTLVRVT